MKPSGLEEATTSMLLSPLLPSSLTWGLPHLTCLTQGSLFFVMQENFNFSD